jgi:large subunit ribosomal protein L18
MKKRELRLRRKHSIRKKVSGNSNVPRLSVFRSNKYIYAQIIDDINGVTLAHASSLKIKDSGVVAAEKVGAEIGKAALTKKIEKVVFDRNGFKFHGSVKALADAARKAGLVF